MKTSKLNAINTMLMCIGEQPVNSLTGSLPSDVNIAVQVLEEISKELQTIGWSFNTDYNYSLVPDSNGEINIPDAWYRVDADPRYYPSMDVVVRDNRLYNRTDQTYIFSESITANRIIQYLKFESLPEVARRYITIRAARVFSNRVVGAQEIDRYTAEDEVKAKSALEDAEYQDAGINIISGPKTDGVLNTYRPIHTFIGRAFN